MVYESIQSGGAGVSIGRNVFQNDRPDRVVSAIKALVHHNATVKEAVNKLR